MSALGTALEEYLALRRSLGYKLERAGELLADFVADLDEVGADHITVELAVDWAMRAANPDSSWRAQRLGVVRCFARYLHTIDPQHQVPPPGLLHRGQRRPEPFLYAEADVVALMAAARRFRSALRALTMETLVGLLAVTGLRVGEVIGLDRDDVDLNRELLVVRNSKLGRSRHVPLHASTTEALGAYRLRQGELFPRPASPALFISTTGTRLRPGNLRTAFVELLEQAGLPPRHGRHGPRIGDLRHSFAVQTLLDWHLAEVDIGPLLPVLSTYLGHVSPASTYWYLSASPPLLGPLRGAAATQGRCRHDGPGAHPRSLLHPAAPRPAPFQPPHHRRLPGHVPAAARLRAPGHRDTPAKLDLEDLDAPFVGAFLDHLEADRGVAVTTRNARLAAVHSFFGFAALRHPEHAALIQRVLAIPAKRTDRGPISYLTRAETDALLAAPDRRTRLGRRDQMLLVLAVETGLRVSELCGLRRGDVTLGTGANVACTGKGRKQRATPLTPATAARINSWLKEMPGEPTDPLFPGPRGRPLTRDAIRRVIDRHVAAAARSCPSIATKHVSPHVLRHSAAMQLLDAGIDTAVIALWLGHESIRTTDIYQHADLAMKERALARLAPNHVSAGRYRPPDALLAFLESL